MRGLEVSRQLAFLRTPEVRSIWLGLNQDLGNTVLQHRIVHPLALLDAWQVSAELGLHLGRVEDVVAQRLDEGGDEGHLGGFLVGEAFAGLLCPSSKSLKVVDQIHAAY